MFKPLTNRFYIALNKPFQVLCQFSQPEGSSKTTLSEFGLPAHVYPIGRLDYDSEGLLLLSDDGRLNSWLLDPVNAHERTYLVQVENIPTAKQLQGLSNGVMIETRKTLPAYVELLKSEPQVSERTPPIRSRKNIPTAWLRLTLTEGRNRQVRKMTAAIDCPTLRLIREAIGQLELSSLDLPPGEWRELDGKQLSLAFEKRVQRARQ